jgi:hypothetical protein
MNRFIQHLKEKGYNVNGEIALLNRQKFRICSGIIEVATGKQKSYWLELD